MPYWERVLVIVVVASVVSLLAKSLFSAQPALQRAQSGTIMPERWSAWFTVLAGCGMVIIGIVLFAKGTGWPSGIFVALGTAIAGFMAPSVTAFHAVHWNQNGMEGPAKLFGPTLGIARTEIAWGDIVKTGKTITSYWYVESSTGRRIYWSYLYKGYGALLLALQEHRPDLPLEF